MTPGGDRDGGSGRTGSPRGTAAAWSSGRSALWRSTSDRWSTSADLFRSLDDEFHFDLDPAPLWALPQACANGLLKSWAGRRVFCNPPYGPEIGRWIGKAVETEVAVYLLPARTDTGWFHDYAMQADEIRFLRGRLRFGDAKNSAPFPSILVIFTTLESRQRIVGALPLLGL